MLASVAASALRDASMSTAVSSAEDAEGGEPRRSRGFRAALVPLVLALAATASLFFLLPDAYDPSIATGDGAVYMVCARNLLAGEGYSYLGDPFTIRPPGFAVLLALPMAFVGADYAVLTAFVGLFGVASVVLLFLLCRPRLGTGVSLAVAAALWLNPGFLRSCGQIMSDVPGLAAMLGCLVLERWARARPSTARDALVGLAIGAAAYVRTMNVFLIPALVLARLFDALKHGRGGLPWPRFVLLRLALPAGLALATLVPWSLRNASIETPVPVEDTLFHSYSVAMWHQDMADPSSPLLTREQLVERVETRVSDLLHVLGSRLQEREPDGIHRMLALGALLCWATVLVVRRDTAEFQVGAMVIVISIYFGFMNRLVLPVYALVLPAVADALVWVLARSLGTSPARAATTVVLLGLATHDYRHEWGWSELRSRSPAFFEACRAVEGQVAPNDVLAADFGAHFSVELDRPVFTLRWVAKRAGPKGVLDLLRRREVDVVVLDRGDPTEAAILSQLRRSGARAVAQAGHYAIVRLSP